MDEKPEISGVVNPFHCLGKVSLKTSSLFVGSLTKSYSIEFMLTLVEFLIPHCLV